MAADPALAALVERVRAARADQTTLNITGGNTKAFYGEAPRGEPLDLRPLAGISSYEPSELVVTVRAGTPLAECGQCLPFEPPRFAALANDYVGGGTVGGMVAAGLAGPARAAVGGVRDYVLGATLLNGKAELLSFGGQVMKNVAGYDVSRLLAGSMGLLGVICEVSLKVLPVPVASTTLRFELTEAAALQQLARWGGQPLPVNASAWWAGTLVLRLSGAAAAVQSAARQLGGEVVDPALATAFWTGLRDQTDEFFAGARQAVAAGATLWRLSVASTAAPLALEGAQMVEWGGAQRWVLSSAPPARLREAAAGAGGHATAFRGAKTDGALAPLSAPLARIHQALKTAFDPDRVFNPGRLYPEL
jgi:glycolate oxidase FAD binding subunit